MNCLRLIILIFKIFIKKGTNQKVETYSGFGSEGEKTNLV
jgi:hypothetical protein